jgi:hypothetical protein
MQVGNDRRWLSFNHTGNSLHALIADGGYRAISGPNRNSWKGLISNSSLQRNCNRQGFNSYHGYAHARIGIIANQEGDCNSPDSRLGIGTGGTACGQNGSVTTGNSARCSADNGDRDIRAYGFVMVR